MYVCIPIIIFKFKQYRFKTHFALKCANLVVNPTVRKSPFQFLICQFYLNISKVEIKIKCIHFNSATEDAIAQRHNNNN